MSGARGTVLVVDDEHATVELIADFLEGKQLGVTRAHPLDEARTVPTLIVSRRGPAQPKA